MLRAEEWDERFVVGLDRIVSQVRTSRISRMPMWLLVLNFRSGHIDAQSRT